MGKEIVTFGATEVENINVINTRTINVNKIIDVNKRMKNVNKIIVSNKVLSGKKRF